MKPSSLFAKGGTLAVFALCASLSGCVATGHGYPYGIQTTVDASFDTGIDYVQPSGAVVGGWVQTYNVAPPRYINGGPPIAPHPGPGIAAPPRTPNPGFIHPTLGGNGTHAYKPPPPSHSAPSIPTAHRK